MKEISVKIMNNAGLHARPSALFVQVTNKFKSEIMVISEGEEVNGKSIMGLMLLAAEKGRTLILSADGPDESEALEALRVLIEVNKFNED